MKIGEVELGKNPVFLAPMEDVSDSSFRLLCRKFGADMVFSEFVSADALIRNVNRTWKKLEINEGERPTVIQIYGREADVIAEAAKRVEEVKPNIIDLNFGCPVKKVAGKGAGAAMLKDIPKMLEIAAATVKAVNTPVTLKTRLGWDDDNIVIGDIAEQLQDVGIQGLTIHGRTRQQMYTGKADWSHIAAVKANPRVHIPITGNGDIDSPEAAKFAFDTYGVDAVMIGRGSIGHPWIFKEIRHYLDTGEHMPPYSLREMVDFLKIQINDAVNWLDEVKGILHSRRHLAASPAFKGLPDFREHRIAMLRANTLDELLPILDTIVEKYSV